MVALGLPHQGPGMVKQSSNSQPNRSLKSSMDEEMLSRLKAEALAPYRGLRQFIYLTFAASALIGGFIFFFKLLAGRETNSALPNFALQIGVFALMVWLFRLEQRNS